MYYTEQIQYINNLPVYTTADYPLLNKLCYILHSEQKPYCLYHVDYMWLSKNGDQCMQRGQGNKGREAQKKRM